MCTLVVEGADLQADVRVATPAGLVATKAHALSSRHRHPDKQASDAYDVFRLLDAFDTDGDVARELVTGPHGLGLLVCTQIEHVFVEEAERTAHRLGNSGVAAMAAVDPDDLRAVGIPFVEWFGGPV